jgi:hypothetical protein
MPTPSHAQRPRPSCAPCVPLPCVGVFARAAPCHHASHLLIARVDAPAAPPTSSFSRRRRRHHPLPGPAQAPAWLEPPRRPPLPRLRWIRRCRGLPGRIHVAAAFSARSAIPLAGSPSSWLDSSLPWPSRPDPPIPLLLCSGRGHPDRRRRVRCRRPPWRGSLTPGRSKKQEGRPAGALLLCRPADR